jgi:arsenate reductase
LTATGGSATADGVGAVVIWHNPACATSRNTLALIRATGVLPDIVEHLKDPPDEATLRHAIADAGLTARAARRDKGTPARELGLLAPGIDDNRIVAAMLAHPILINQPFVRTPLGVRLCRPSERVLEILDAPLVADVTKEDGEVVRAGPPAA